MRPFRILKIGLVRPREELFRRIDTRVYARKQQTWFRRDTSITWFHPDDAVALFRFLRETL